MKVGDLVSLTDNRGEHTGTVTQITESGFDKGLVSVRWESGVTERCDPKELKVIGVKAEGAPSTKKVEDAPLVTKSGKVLTDDDIEALADEAEAGYDLGDPKHPSFRERIVAFWDEIRPGK